MAKKKKKKRGAGGILAKQQNFNLQVQELFRHTVLCTTHWTILGNSMLYIYKQFICSALSFLYHKVMTRCLDIMSATFTWNTQLSKHQATLICLFHDHVRSLPGMDLLFPVHLELPFLLVGVTLVSELLSSQCIQWLLVHL